MNCEGCGCTDTDACFDEQANGPCSWASTRPPVCSVCTQIALRMAEAEEADVAALRDEPRVQVYSEHEAQEYIEERRAMAGGMA